MFSSGGGWDIGYDVHDFRNVFSVISVCLAIISWAYVYQITGLILRDVALALAQPIAVVDKVQAVIRNAAAFCL